MQIARTTRTPGRRVKATTWVARSAAATAILGRYPLTLEQAAVIAAADDGTETGREAVKLLAATAQREPTQFAHVAQRLRVGVPQLAGAGGQHGRSAPPLPKARAQACAVNGRVRAGGPARVLACRTSPSSAAR